MQINLSDLRVCVNAADLRNGKLHVALTTADPHVTKQYIGQCDGTLQ